MLDVEIISLDDVLVLSTRLADRNLFNCPNGRSEQPRTICIGCLTKSMYEEPWKNRGSLITILPAKAGPLALAWHT